MRTQTQLAFSAMYAPRTSRAWGLAGWIRAAATRWTQRRMLEELGDRDLRDIGISRSEAITEARKPFWRG
jgi:uncharacterized protein YjiS (DUF1127 family)